MQFRRPTLRSKIASSLTAPPGCFGGGKQPPWLEETNCPHASSLRSGESDENAFRPMHALGLRFVHCNRPFCDRRSIVPNRESGRLAKAPGRCNGYPEEYSR
jgi:hypothetical protein